MPEAPLPTDLPAIQRFIDDWIRRRGRYWSPLSQYARLAEEVGELGRELNFRYGDKPRGAKDEGGSIIDELGDVFFIVIVLANDLGIDLQACLESTLQKYGERSER
ncbi:MAG TPA: nucleotide pyrophosphohydrolase [Candidatus Dormibacteraeota bacterium]|nr:nucleotide pyrophosphohydrolase [Candidatus Dormibacteraeota bacterium]